MLTSKKLLPAFVIITSLFFMWGLANNMTDTLLAAFKRIMSMTDLQTSWIQVAFYGSYFCLALPAAFFIKKYNYKTGVLLGLGLFISGALLFYPASQTMVYGHFLAALFILAGGLSILETTANPYILALGPPDTAVRRLNLAQSFNPIGSITGVFLSKLFILSKLNKASAEERAGMDEATLAAIQQDELSAVMGPYVGVALVLVILWLAIWFTHMPAASDESRTVRIGAAFKRLFAQKKFVWGVIAQFFYVGAQIGVWSFTIRYVMQELHLNEEQASSWYLVSLVCFMVSRFICTALMKVITPSSLLLALSVLAAVFSFLVITLSGLAGVIALVAISGCMSLMFPTIYGLAAQNLGEDTKIGGSVIIMAILGGAILTSIQGQVSDVSGSIKTAYWVPLLCFLVVAFYAFIAGSTRTVASK
ncbi:MAG TPA: L-fucose:H+ symporter permease [Phnomibacter sp.]|nr:L-fucose:H+ symporter permease [Phnomibacter sp.]